MISKEEEVARLKAIFDDAGKGEHNVLALVEHYQEREAEADEAARKAVAEAETLKARIAELEAAAQWRTMDTAPRDGTKVLIASLTNQYLPPRVFAFRDRWVSQSVELTDKQAKEHNAVWLPIPALPEGGV